VEISLSILRNTWYIWLPIILFGTVLPNIVKVIKPKIKGYLGEKTAALLFATLDKKKYKTINNLIIKTDDQSTQIDHVVVSNYGIFVIETKNYKGWIIGDESGDYWKQVIYKEKNNFFNPIKQNQYHIKFLKSTLKIFPEVQYYSIVSFADEADIKVKTAKDVVHEKYLLRTIKNYQNEIISNRLKDEIFDYLKIIKKMNMDYGRKHVKNIKRKRSIINMEKKSSVCPRCGSSLIQRNGKYGSFLGCSNYPRCKFTIDIN